MGTTIVVLAIAKQLSIIKYPSATTDIPRKVRQVGLHYTKCVKTYKQDCCDLD